MMRGMRAVVLDAPGPPEALRIRELPTPVPEPGWVLIEVKAFGLNRSELHTRLGLAEGVTFPRVLGIEATGVVVDAPGGEFAAGQQVVAMMGGMGRKFDGGYAEYTCVPAGNVIPFRSELDWSTLGAVPEMLQTAYGSLSVGLELRAGQTLLIRGGTSSVGMAAAVLAKSRGATVLSTTRRADRFDALRARRGRPSPPRRGRDRGRGARPVPDGVDAALELVGTNVLQDTLRATRVQRRRLLHRDAQQRVDRARLLSHRLHPDRRPPHRLRRRGLRPPRRRVAGLPRRCRRRPLTVPVDRVYEGLDQVPAAHADMEAGNAAGKLVVIP